MPKNGWTVAVAWMLCAACGHLSAASKPGFKVDVFRPKPGGLPSSVVLAVVQSSDGYLWLGTLEGLARFDGVDFAIFDESNTPELKSRQIVSLFQDSRQNLWVGTENTGVALVQNGNIRHFDIGQVKAVCEDKTGGVWLYSGDGQLCQYREGKTNIWRAGPDSPSICRTLAADDSGLLWVGTDTNLAALGPISSNLSVGLPVAQEAVVSNRLDLLLTSKHGGYWRLADFRIQKWKANHAECDWPYPWATNSPPVAACEDLEGNLVVGTYGGGVYWFDAQGNETKISSDEGLSHDSALSVTVDREGNLWVGTNGGGLNRVKRQRQLFNVVETTRGKTVQSVCEDARGGLWIGYHSEAIAYSVSNTAQEFQLFVPKVSGHPYVQSVFVDRNQGVWAGASGQRVPHLFQFQGSLFAPIGASFPEVSAIHQDRTGVLWVGTKEGLVRLDGRGFKAFRTQQGLSANDVRAITDDREGSLWIGTAGGGLNRLNQGHFSVFGTTNGLPSGNISSLYSDPDGVLWVGTSSGLARFRAGKWTNYSQAQGLASKSLSYIVEDSEGYLWIGSNYGLLRVRKKALNDLAEGRRVSNDPISWRSYGESDGLPSGECTTGSQPGAIRTRDGRLYFPTIAGLVFVNPAQILRNTNPPPVVIESVLVDGELQHTNTLGSAPPQSVTIPPRKESLDFKYTSLNLAAPDKGRFRYKLDGYETAWRETPWDLRVAHYPKVPHGHYRFLVVACNEDDVWSKIGAGLEVMVQPPFWSTTWFRILAALSLLALIAGPVYYVSTQRLQRQLATLRQQEALEKERSRIARDLHDQLGANLTQVALLGEMAEEDKHSPQEIEAHARQISQTARDTTHALDEIVWTVNPSNDTLDGLVTYLCKYAQEYFAVAGLRYRLDVPSELPATPISPELRHNVFLASKEAITNVVRHAKASEASIRLRLDAEQFTLEIQDNGQGLGGLNEKSDRNGLRNMRKRMEDIGGEFSIAPVAEGGAVVRLTAPL